MSRSPSPVSVHVPSAGADKPSWVKVGVIAVVGFGIGVAWPRLAGIRPGPSAPGEATAAAGTRAPEGPTASAAVAATPAASASAPSAAPASPGTASSGASPVAMTNAPPAVLVTRGAVLTCKTQEGEVLRGADKCGSVPAFDALAQPRLKKLAYCPQAHGASGKLSVVFNLDFTRNKIGFTFGKTTTVDNKDSLDMCLRMALENVSLNAVAHDNPLYGVFYSVTFTPRDSSTGSAPVAEATPGGAATGGAADTEGSPQTAQVAWEVAIVRDAPRTGGVVGRLQRGAKVRVSTGQDGWYRVKYGPDFGSEGWVYRGAIGK
jgi:hypothetical protein